MEPPLSTKPIRYVLKWQALATLAIAAVAGIWAGVHGALSAMLGGFVNLAACVVYAFVLGYAVGRVIGNVYNRLVGGGA